ncbi:hypothetical protein MWU75_18555 [Ornithinimicrobium sp. F0845]|uniref:hypothetical protein n=1 Tax=Ornithinimicrobium sp. F0845 TaxID=2926412 RepID=UPI001FF41173|nr:hypothetical protein [Ornithinimicrobium sp. F0845]MCK0114144.1 hypothetical protein [Ornithinimicrobium sp. F0845]
MSPAQEEAHPLAPTPPELLPTAVKVRHIANWVNLSTLLGLGVARAGGADVRSGPRKLYLAEHYRWRFPAGGAFTVGDVVITRHDIDDLCARRPHLLEHEEAHSRQWMACLGLPFLPLYVASMGWSWLRTGDRASYSFFERSADLEKGGYRDVPPRPLMPVIAAGARQAMAFITGRRSADTGVEVGTNRPD